MNFYELLGDDLKSPVIMEMMRGFGIQQPTRIPKGEDTAYASSLAQGLELTFQYAESLPNLFKHLPEGALVLCNIRLYGIDNHEFSKYSGELPDGLKFGEKIETVRSRLGEPTWVGLNGTKFRWNRGNARLVVGVDGNSAVNVVSLDLPA